MGHTTARPMTAPHLDAHSSGRRAGRPRPVPPRPPSRARTRRALLRVRARSRHGDIHGLPRPPFPPSVMGTRRRTEGREPGVVVRAGAAARDGRADADTVPDLPPASAARPRSSLLSGADLPLLPPTDLQEGARTHRSESSLPEKPLPATRDARDPIPRRRHALQSGDSLWVTTVRPEQLPSQSGPRLGRHRSAPAL